MSCTMWNRNRIRASGFIALLLLQIMTPFGMINASASPQTDISTNVDLNLLSDIGIHPSGDVENGWIESSQALSQINLQFRNANVIPLDNWGEWTESSNYIQGWYVITHTFPIPTEWKYELKEAGIDCFSYLPPNGFHCDISGHTIEQLEDLKVEGIFQLDSVDKVREDLVRGLLGRETDHYNPYAVENFARVNLMLSGEELPEGTYSHSDIKVNSHGGRFATLTVNTDGFRWLTMQGEIEWVETSPYFLPTNTVGAGIIHADDLKDSTKMNNAVAGWDGLDGSGIVVTVGDSGIDNGVNNSGMHPDFADHIKGILSWPDPNCAWSSPGVPGPSCDDGAEDDHQMPRGNGHGTHVAGSVLGDGTHSNGAIIGVAPEAQLLFHAWEQNGCYGCGIPNNLVDMLDLASENGSRIHTNSWGAPAAGVYTTSSAQIDEGSAKHDDIVVLFAAGNDGIDGDSNGEIDLDSLGSPSTAKNSITIGASENYRPIYGGDADNISGMARFSSRGPTDDGRIKPDFVAPGTYILSTFSRSAGTTACWDLVNASYCYMGGTSMATPLAAGATALLLQHLMENRGIANPSSALIKAIYGANSHDMMGQFSSPTNGAGETVPNPHEGLGLLNMWSSKDASFVDYESLSTTDDRGWSFNVPAAAQDLQLALAYHDPKSTPSAGTHLVNDLDLAVKDPLGVWTNLTDNLNNLRMLNFSAPTAGTWEVHVIGTSVPDGPQFFSLALNADYSLTNLTQDADFDGVEDGDDDCPLIFGNSTNDRAGCIDSDGDGYSDPDGVWTVVDGADALISVDTQWVDQDSDGYGDNPAPAFQPDGCTITPGTSNIDRFGCPDADSDGYSDPDGGWTAVSGADSCPGVVGISNVDRNGCPDEDSDGVSDPDPSGTNGSVWTVANGADAYLGDSSQWADTDGDGYGDNPPPATTGDSCPGISGTSTLDRYGCTDTDSDGWSDPDGVWTTANNADAFINEPTQWADSDGDGYGDNSAGVNPDHCPSAPGTSTEMGHLGCPDSDGDGYWDSDDEFVSDGTQWVDADDDGFGENPTGNNPDMCPTVQGFSDQDRNGCPDTDGDGYSDEDPSGTNGPVWTTADGADIWPLDMTQWADSDGDGYGDNTGGTNGDGCPSISGTSTADRFGCLDSDGDGYSDADGVWTTADGADAYPSDPSKWSDFDGDGLADQGGEDDCPNFAGTSIHDRMGCPDTDGDGYSDSDSGWTFADGADVFNSDSTQWNDTDSDGYGDEPTGNLADDCPSVWGDSWRNNTLGCLDTDKDGWADHEDAQPNESTQWSDIDGDGYGDNLAGVMPDACPGVAGNSTLGNRMGCPDDDGDGWDNDNDAIDDNPTQWLDQDGDGYGDNATGFEPDSCPGVAGNSTIDRFGCVDNDGDGISNESDSFPDDPTRSQDTDGDGFDDLEDDCIDVIGNSTNDRIGCRDTDGDGYSDETLPVGNSSGWNISNGADAFPLEPSQWNDSDGDGYGDNASGFQADDCPSEEGYSNINEFGCPDGDNDGTSQDDDAFPDDSTQWLDTDGDGFGDNPNGTNPDACISIIGTSTIDRFGCPDEDSDGASDLNDLWLGDITQWFDSDGDSYGDQENGTMGDSCPQTFGTSSQGTKHGCLDGDGDLWADIEDAFPTEDSQWLDTDGDGWGDNQTAGSYRLDHWPSDPTKNAGEAEMTCSSAPEIDLASSGQFTFTCTITTQMSNAGVRIEWQSMSSVTADSNIQVLTFDSQTGSTQIVSFAGNAKSLGNYDLIITAKEPGSDIAMDTVSIPLTVKDSRIVDENIDDQTDFINKVLREPIAQAILGGLLLFVLMGVLIIRGKANTIRRNSERREHAQVVLKNRINNQSISDEIRRVEFGLNRDIPPPPPGFE